MKIAIGLIGEKRAGKSTFIKILKEFLDPMTLEVVSSGEILMNVLRLWHLETTRANLQRLPVLMEIGFGPGALTNAVYHTMISKHASVVVFDGVRWHNDVQMIQRFNKNLLVYITADARKRWKRSLLLQEKLGENTSSFKDFCNEEQASTEVFIPILGAGANVKIVNNGTPANFYRKINTFQKKIVEML